MNFMKIYKVVQECIFWSLQLISVLCLNITFTILITTLKVFDLDCLLSE